MNLFIRRIVYTFFIILFLLTAPLVVLYTMGYRYNFAVKRIQKTGMMKITSIPKEARIYLNGIKYEKSLTPAKIEHLLPGDYEIRLSKENYHDWQKKLAVYENGTTFAEKIILWKKAQPEKIDFPATAWSTSPDGNKIAFSQNNLVKILNINSGLLGELEGGEIIKLIELPKGFTVNKIDFSPNSKTILINSEISGKTQYWLYSLDWSKPLKLPTNLIGIKFNQNDNEIYGFNHSEIFLIDSQNLLTKKIWSAGKNLTDILVDGNKIYLIDGKTLKILDLSKNLIINLEEVTSDNYHLTEIIASNLLLIDNTKKTMSIVDLTRRKKTLNLEAKAIDILNDHSILFYNDWEIFIYDFNKDAPELITRMGEMILAASWHPKGRHLFFSTQQAIKVIELDNRELRNIIDIVQDKNVSALRFNRFGDILYFNSETGVEKIKLQ